MKRPDIEKLREAVHGRDGHYVAGLSKETFDDLTDYILTLEALAGPCTVSPGPVVTELRKLHPVPPEDKRLGAWCPECGPQRMVDEDGCCLSCGGNAIGDGADDAIRALGVLTAPKPELPQGWYEPHPETMSDGAVMALTDNYAEVLITKDGRLVTAMSPQAVSVPVAAVAYAFHRAGLLPTTALKNLQILHDPDFEDDDDWWLMARIPRNGEFDPENWKYVGCFATEQLAREALAALFTTGVE